MKIGLIAGAVLIILFLMALARALIRGVTKTRLRFICVALCAVAAFFITVKAGAKVETVYLEHEAEVQNYLNEQGMQELVEFISGSSASRETVEGLVYALIAPILFVVLFYILRFLTWILYFIFTLALRKKIINSCLKHHIFKH